MGGGDEAIFVILMVRGSGSWNGMPWVGDETEAMAWSAGLDLGWGFLRVGEGLYGPYSGQEVSIASELDVMSFVAD